MRRVLWILVIGISLLATSVTADEARQDERDARDDRAPKDQGEDETAAPQATDDAEVTSATPAPEPAAQDDDEDLGGRGREREAERRDESGRTQRLPGQLVEDKPNVRGNYVQFETPASGCIVRDHVAATAGFFLEVHVPGPCREDLRRSEYRLIGDDAGLRAHDAPGGLIHFHASGDAALRFVLAPGVVADPKPFGFALSAGEATARLVVDPEAAELTPEGITVRGARGNFFVEEPTSNLVARKEIQTAVEERRLAGSVVYIPQGSAPVVDALVLDDVEVRAAAPHEGTLRVWLDSNLSGGRSFAFHLPAQDFVPSELAVDYFDVDETGRQLPVPIAAAADLEDASEAADGEGPEYAAAADGEWTRVVVSVPHFSAHVIQVSSFAAVPPPSVLGGLVLGLLASGEAAALMFMGRRRNK